MINPKTAKRTIMPFSGSNYAATRSQGIDYEKAKQLYLDKEKTGQGSVDPSSLAVWAIKNGYTPSFGDTWAINKGLNEQQQGGYTGWVAPTAQEQQNISNFYQSLNQTDALAAPQNAPIRGSNQSSKDSEIARAQQVWADADKLAGTGKYINKTADQIRTDAHAYAESLRNGGPIGSTQVPGSAPVQSLVSNPDGVPGAGNQQDKGTEYPAGSQIGQRVLEQPNTTDFNVITVEGVTYHKGPDGKWQTADNKPYAPGPTPPAPKPDNPLGTSGPAHDAAYEAALKVLEADPNFKSYPLAIQSIFRSALKTWDFTKELNMQNVIDEFQKVKTTVIDPRTRQEVDKFIGDMTKDVASLNQSYDQLKETNAATADQNIRQAKADQEKAGMTFTGKAIEALGAKSAYPQPGQAAPGQVDPVTGQPSILGGKQFELYKQPTTEEFQQYLRQYISEDRANIPPDILAAIQRMEKDKGSPVTVSDLVKIKKGTLPVPKITPPMAVDPNNMNLEGARDILANPDKYTPEQTKAANDLLGPRIGGPQNPGGMGFWTQLPDGSYVGEDSFTGQTRPIGWNPNNPNSYGGTAYGQQRQQNQQGAMPFQTPFGGVFNEGSVNQASRLMASSAATRYQQQLDQMGKAGEAALGGTQMGGLIPGYTPSGTLPGSISDYQQGMYGTALTGILNQNGQNMSNSNPLDWNFPKY